MIGELCQSIDDGCDVELIFGPTGGRQIFGANFQNERHQSIKACDEWEFARQLDSFVSQRCQLFINTNIRSKMSLKPRNCSDIFSFFFTKFAFFLTNSDEFACFYNLRGTGPNLRLKGPKLAL